MPRGWMLAAACADMALYLVMVSLPFRALDLGATSTALGLIPFLYALPYATMAWLAGRRSDRVDRVTSIRAGVTGAAVGAGALSVAPDLFWILACIPLLGVSLAFHWPALQALVAEGHGMDLPSRVARFNVGWSGGKAVGFLLGGWLTATLGGRTVCAVAGLAFLSCAFLVRAAPTPVPGTRTPDAPPSPALPAFRQMAWLANGGAFALAATLNHHYPRLLLAQGGGADRFGLFLGGVFGAQLLSFLLLAGTSSRWAYRRGRFVAALAALALATATVPHVPFRAVLAAGPLLGLALGFFYQSSLYYSVKAPGARGGRAGIHESVLGLSSAAVPLFGGMLAQARGDATVPFTVAAATLAALAGLSWVRLRGTSG